VLLKGSGTEAVQRNARVVDDKVNALSVRLLQMLCKVLDAGLIRDIQVVVPNLREPAVGLEGFGLLQLRILFELLEGGLSPALVARGEVDEEGAVVERRFGILKCELADDCEADALGNVRWSR